MRTFRPLLLTLPIGLLALGCGQGGGGAGAPPAGDADGGLTGGSRRPNVAGSGSDAAVPDPGLPTSDAGAPDRAAPVDARPLPVDGGVAPPPVDAAPDLRPQLDAQLPDVAPSCEPQVREPPAEQPTHVGACRITSWKSVPPSSGAHYDEWAAYGIYAKPVPWGFLVHNLEHGAVVFAYNCPEGCPRELSMLEALVRSLPDDPLCATGAVKKRVVLVPDPTLDVRFAASAWGATLRAPCFDADGFRAFYLARRGRGPEPLQCDEGVDRSVDGWCR